MGRGGKGAKDAERVQYTFDTPDLERDRTNDAQRAIATDRPKLEAACDDIACEHDQSRRHQYEHWRDPGGRRHVGHKCSDERDDHPACRTGRDVAREVAAVAMSRLAD